MNSQTSRLKFNLRSITTAIRRATRVDAHLTAQFGARLTAQWATLATTLILVACQPISSTSHSRLNLTSDDKIIGGQLATGQEGFSATTVGLFNVAEQSLCSASILSDSILITAGHCVAGAPSDLRVIFGIDTNADSAIIQTVVDTRASVIWPIRQTEPLNSGDVALVKFTGGLPSGYHPVQVLTDVNALKNGDDIVLAGFGVTDNSKKADPKADFGAGVLRSVVTTIRDATFTVSEVAVEQSFGKGSCHGDSGGPAFVTVNGTSYLFGVTSRGTSDPDDTCRVAALYTNLIYYQNWIRQTQAELTNEAL